MLVRLVCGSITAAQNAVDQSARTRSGTLYGALQPAVKQYHATLKLNALQC
jgi:hypothetical protein